ncbi:hypothetical protein AGABI2DRAFT_187461 [Agaricus bisporus var. bisporus H97]|uniref:hypothetical protein n=1 Tax=Agaricus bisporus var. bisporus (strain H97 / ATCC MYA-4626 / FGSC 10389) TaxID=936046 RepID=UPI00029F7843|nr:hypothetical protein AGABI2DRAFT_187461 [Agaricus bisporus var. bisporus H97]EKV44766.1 hypothetical protein AGABI2DRAFT_187461 [Agaricus bisporus var. bisporus H97]
MNPFTQVVMVPACSCIASPWSSFSRWSLPARQPMVNWDEEKNFEEQWSAATFLLNLLFAPSVQTNLSLSEACFSTSQTLNGLAECLEDFTVLKGTYNRFTYLEAQPTVTQRDAWFKATYTLLYTDNNCTTSILPSAIQDIYAIDLFTDISGKSFCVLYERTVNPCSKLYEKGWGFAMVPASRAGVSRLIHISAPHPFFDGETTVEAAQIFSETGAKSLLVPGRMRNAFYAPSPCVQPSSKSSMYYITDPAHNDQEPFFDANLAVWDWQNQQGGCPSSSCAFIQFHGKAEKTCSEDTIFLSTGLSRGSWYTDSVDRPIKRLQRKLVHAFHLANAPGKISLPSHSRCILTATKNVVGRYINNYPTSSTQYDVCHRSAIPDTTEGAFVHAEQNAFARSDKARGAWVRALNNTFASINV